MRERGSEGLEDCVCVCVGGGGGGGGGGGCRGGGRIE